MNIPSDLTDNKSLKEFLERTCLACMACPQLITLEPGPEKCPNCLTNSIKRKSESDSGTVAISPKRKIVKEEINHTPNESAVPTSSSGKLIENVNMNITRV